MRLADDQARVEDDVLAVRAAFERRQQESYGYPAELFDWLFDHRQWRVDHGCPAGVG